MMEAMIRLRPTFLAAMLAPGVAWAGTPRTHDGFYLSLSAGPGYNWERAARDQRSTLHHGNCSTVDFAIGGTIRQRVSVHLDVWTWRTGGPDHSTEGGGVLTSPGRSVENTLAVFGLGATYHLPRNLSITTMVGAGELNMDSGDAPDDERWHYDSDHGPVLRTKLSKEWWITRGWGLGLAAVVGTSTMPDKDDGPAWHALRLGAALQTTFN